MTFENVEEFLAKFKRKPEPEVDYAEVARQKLEEISRQILGTPEEVSHWAANLESDEEALEALDGIVDDLQDAVNKIKASYTA